jgi:hypothetical protein
MPQDDPAIVGYLRAKAALARGPIDADGGRSVSEPEGPVTA